MNHKNDDNYQCNNFDCFISKKCNNCEKIFPINKYELYTCKKCDIDLCNKCYENECFKKCPKCKNHEHIIFKESLQFEKIIDTHDISEQIDMDITDSDILNFILLKYKLNKLKIINMIKKLKEKEIKNKIIKIFYKKHDIYHKSIHEQYIIFLKWLNKTNYKIEISKDDYENYYDNHF